MTVAGETPFFARAGWFAAWREAFAPGRDTVQWSLAGVDIPLRPVRQGAARWGRVLSAPANEHTPCLRLPLPSEAAEAALAESLAALYRERRFSWLVFPLLPQGAAEIRCLEGLRARGWSVLVEPHPHTALADLHAGWEAYHQGLSKKLRSNTNRARNGLMRLGALTYQETVAEGDWRRCWAEMLDLEAAGWKGAAAGAIRCRPEVAAFYEAVLEEAAQAGALRLYALRLDGRLIAANLVVVDGATAYGWKTAYDPQLAKYSPGNVLQRYVTQALAEAGVATLDMLDPVSEWKRRWASRIEPRLHLRLFPPGWRGRAWYRVARWRAARTVQGGREE